MPSSCTGPLTGAPKSSIEPSVAGTKPAIMLSMVLLPHPLGPRIETNSPAAIVKETLSTAWTSPLRDWKRLVTLRTATAALSPMTPAPRLAGSAPAVSPALPVDELVGVVRRGLLRRHAAVALEHFEHLFPVVLVRPTNRMSLGAGGVELLFKRNPETFAQQIAAEIGIELETGLDSGVRLLGGGFPTLLARRHELFDEIG